MRRAPLLALLAVTLALAACGKDKQDEAFGARVRDYLLRHPEVMLEVQDKLREKQAAEMKKVTVTALNTNRALLERDPRDFVANPNGKVTVVEFYDYRCPHCVNVAPAVVELIRENPDVRFVFKELPIFGAPSERAARAVLSVKKTGGDYLGAYHDLMAARPVDEAAVRRVLTARGVDPDASEGPLRDELNKHLGDTQRLAAQIGLQGTPHFVIGDTVVEGENMEAVKAAIEAGRKKK